MFVARVRGVVPRTRTGTGARSAFLILPLPVGTAHRPESPDDSDSHPNDQADLEGGIGDVLLHRRLQDNGGDDQDQQDVRQVPTHLG